MKFAKTIKNGFLSKNFVVCNIFSYTCYLSFWNFLRSHLMGCNLRNPMSLWWCNHVTLRGKMKTLHLYFHKTYHRQTWQSGDLCWLGHAYHETCSFDHVVTWCYIIKWKYYTSTSVRHISIKLGTVVSFAEGIPPIKLRDS